MSHFLIIVPETDAPPALIGEALVEAGHSYDAIYPTERFASHQMVQCDIIPAVGAPYHSCNIEDGIALLDESGRAELREKFPGLADRIEARRAFMRDVLGIRLKPEVLPLSNLAAALAPYLLAPQRIFSKA